ncbi:MAG TPA: 30S ribosomal protein S5, partial [Candidatus Angelobacter sp.]|nr:30S ribosomal protein S5 [Candidatus Angelobacter sp.]
RGRRTRGRGPGSGGPPQAGGPDTRDRGGREGRERREPDGRERREPDGDKAPWAASHLQSES